MNTYELLSQLITIRLNGGTKKDLGKFFNGLTEDELNYLIAFGEGLVNICRGQLRSRQMLEEILGEV